jgi:hypothetical protein
MLMTWVIFAGRGMLYLHDPVAHLIIWSGNLAEETLIFRHYGGWQFVGSSGHLHFFAPFLVLLSHLVKRRIRWLVIVAGWSGHAWSTWHWLIIPLSRNFSGLADIVSGIAMADSRRFLPGNLLKVIAVYTGGRGEVLRSWQNRSLNHP